MENLLGWAGSKGLELKHHLSTSTSDAWVASRTSIEADVDANSMVRICPSTFRCEFRIVLGYVDVQRPLVTRNEIFCLFLSREGFIASTAVLFRLKCDRT